jgi:hypothetical protein
MNSFWHTSTLDCSLRRSNSDWSSLVSDCRVQIYQISTFGAGWITILALDQISSRGNRYVWWIKNEKIKLRTLKRRFVRFYATSSSFAPSWYLFFFLPLSETSRKLQDAVQRPEKTEVQFRYSKPRTSSQEIQSTNSSSMRMLQERRDAIPDPAHLEPPRKSPRKTSTGPSVRKSLPSNPNFHSAA